MIKVEDLKNDT